MPPALPFPAHKHPPTTVGPLGILNSLPGGLPADQGDSAPVTESPTEGEKSASDPPEGTVPGEGKG